MRVNVYVDGFNLYYRALKKSSHKWLNLHKLAEGLLDEGDEIGLVRYFTARVSSRAGDPDAPRRQQIYLNALETLPKFKPHFGNFLSNPKWRPINHPKWRRAVCVEIINTEEKGSDVNLATHLLNDAWHGNFEAALILSQDTDLVEPIKIVREELEKTIGLVWLDGREAGGKLAKLAHFIRHLTPTRLSEAQFPDEIITETGRVIRKPETW